MDTLCTNCQLKAICDIYLRHKDNVQIFKCTYSDLISNTSSGIKAYDSVKENRSYRNRDITTDLKTLYTPSKQAPIVGTCEICGAEDVEIETCQECNKNICWNCACTNINDNYVYCPDCMDNHDVEI